MNVLEEFKDHLQERTIKCAIIEITYPIKVEAVLKCYYSTKELSIFLSKINIDDKEEVFDINGTIWYKDGSYSTRRGDNVSEWWEHFSAPKLPKKVKR